MMSVMHITSADSGCPQNQKSNGLDNDHFLSALYFMWVRQKLLPASKATRQTGGT